MAGTPSPSPHDRRVSEDRREDTRRPKPGRRITDLATHPDAWLLVPAIAEYLAVDYRTVDKWIDAGILPAYRFNGLWRVKRIDLEAFIEKSAYRVG